MFFLKPRFFIFALVGGTGTAAHFLTLSLLVEVAHLSPIFSSNTGYIIGFLVNYLLNYAITFRSRANHFNTISKYLIMTLVGFIMNWGIIFLVCKIFQIHYLLGQLIATGTIFLFNYHISCCWVFSENHS